MLNCPSGWARESASMPNAAPAIVSMVKQPAMLKHGHHDNNDDGDDDDDDGGGDDDGDGDDDG